MWITSFDRVHEAYIFFSTSRAEETPIRIFLQRIRDSWYFISPHRIAKLTPKRESSFTLHDANGVFSALAKIG